MPSAFESNKIIASLFFLTISFHSKAEISMESLGTSSSQPIGTSQDLSNLSPSDPGSSNLLNDKTKKIDKKTIKSSKPTHVESSQKKTTPFIGNQAYMAVRGNNYFTGSSDYIITFSLNNSNGGLTNRQQTFTETFATTSPAPFNFALILQGQLPSDINTETISQITWVVVNGTTYLATRGYVKSLGEYIAIYTLDTTIDATSGKLINKQTIFVPQTEPLTNIQWVVVNNTAYLATWGFDTQFYQYFIAVYVLDQISGALINKQKILLDQAQSINQITWTVANDIAYLGVWGLNNSRNLYFISIYTLDQTNGSLINVPSKQNTYMASSESITQIEWVVIQNASLQDVSYLAVNGYDILSNRPFIAIFTLNETTGGLANKQKTFLLQQETCNQIEWVVINNNAYLGIWGLDSLQNQYYLSTFILNPTTGSLANRKKNFTPLSEMINFITWVVVNNTAYLATPGFDNFQNKAFIVIYTLNKNTIQLTNPQITFLTIQTSIIQIEWVVANQKAYLGVRGYNNLQNRFYLSVFTLSTNNGSLFNNQIRLASTGETFYQFEWVAL